MSTLAQLIGRKNAAIPVIDKAGQDDIAASAKSIGEVVWGATTFLLFLALGPFSAVAVVIGVFSLSRNQEAIEPKVALR